MKQNFFFEQEFLYFREHYFIRYVMQHTPAIPRVLVESELERILASKGFQNSPILCRFLRYIVGRTLDGQQREIKEYTIGTQVLDKPNDFNRTTDPSVRIHAIRLRKQLEDYYAQKGAGAVVKIDIPKGTYIPVVSMVKQVHQALAETSVQGVSYKCVDEWRETLCVIPFDGLVRGVAAIRDVQCFTDYLTEQLSLFQELRTLPVASVSALLMEGYKADQIAQSLGTDYVVSGSLELDDFEGSFTVRVHETATQMLIWSHTYQESAVHCNAEVMMRKLAGRMASSIGGYTGVLFTRRHQLMQGSEFPSMQAEALYYFYRNQLHNDAQTFHEAIGRIENLVKQNRDCALCFALLASLYADGIVYGYHSIEDPQRKAHYYAKRALALEPRNQHALFARAWLAVMEGDTEGTELFVQRMISENPNSSFFSMVQAMGMSFIGKYERSIQIVKEAMVNTPVPSWWIHVPHTVYCLKRRDFEGTLFHARKIGRLNTIFDSVFEIIALYQMGHYDEMFQLAAAYYTKFPEGLQYLRKNFALIFHDDDLRQLLNECMVGVYRKSMEMYDAYTLVNRS